MRTLARDALLAATAVALVWALEPLLGVSRYVAGPIAVFLALVIAVGFDRPTQGTSTKR